MSSRMRVTKGHTGKRRSHHHLKTPRLSKCANCGADHLRHKMCPECGYYRGKLIVDMLAKTEKKLKKAQADTQEAGENKPKKADKKTEEKTGKKVAKKTAKKKEEKKGNE